MKGRSRWALALGLGSAAVAALHMGFFSALREAASAPVINDYSTNVDDPPAFVVAKAGGLPSAWKDLVKRAGLRPLHVLSQSEAGELPPTQAVLDAVVEVARKQPRWEVVHVGDAVVEAVSTTRLMRFRDDVIVRVRPQQQQQAPEDAAQKAGGSLVIDMRSRSRVGKGDLGTNAARIRGFLAQLSEELQRRGMDVA